MHDRAQGRQSPPARQSTARRQAARMRGARRLRANQNVQLTAAMKRLSQIFSPPHSVWLISVP